MPPKTDETPTSDTPQQPDTPDTSQGNSEGQAVNDDTFTQDDVDRIVGERAKRAAEATTNKFLEALGVESLEAAKTALTDYRERKQAEMTEAEKAEQAAQEARERAAQLEKQIETMKADQLQRQRDSQLDAALRAAGGQDVDQLRILLRAKDGELVQSLFGDDNAQADDKKLSAFIKQVQANYPRYFGIADGGSPGTSGGVAPVSRQAAIEAAKKEIKRKHSKL